MAKIRELTYVAFDLEATCHPSFSFHEVIEIGAVKMAPKTLKIGDTFESLVQPLTPIIKPIIEKTGITDSLVRQAPQIGNIWKNFVSFVGNSVLVGHQVSLDMGILEKSIKRHDLKPLNNSALDTMRLARRLYPKRRSYALEEFQGLLGLEVASHRTKSDAYVTGVLFGHLVELAEEKYGILEFKDLENFCSPQKPLQSKLF